MESCGCATRFLVPTRCPVLLLTRGAAVPGFLALRANLEVLQKAHDLAPLVEAILSPLQRFFTKPFEPCSIMSPLPQPMNHAGQDIQGDVMALHETSQRGDPGGLPHVPNLAGVGMVTVHEIGELQASGGGAILGCLAPPLHRPPLAPRYAAL